MPKENEISSAEILHRNFSSSMFGYNKNEVEAFLEKIALYIESLEKKISQYSRELALLHNDDKESDQKNEDYKNREELISKTLIMAEMAKDEVLKNARMESDNIIKEAELEVKKMVADSKKLVSVIEHEIFNLEERKRMFLMKFKAEMEAMLATIKQDELLKENKSKENESKKADTAASERGSIKDE